MDIHQSVSEIHNVMVKNVNNLSLLTDLLSVFDRRIHSKAALPNLLFEKAARRSPKKNSDAWMSIHHCSVYVAPSFRRTFTVSIWQLCTENIANCSLHDMHVVFLVGKITSPCTQALPSFLPSLVSEQATTWTIT